MLWVPQKGILQVQHNAGTVGSATPGTVVPTGAAEATYGAMTELIASTTFDTYWVQIIAHGYALSATDSQGVLTLYTGAATEEIWIEHLLMGFCGVWTVGGPKIWNFPLYLPAGTRIAAQASGKQLSNSTLRVLIALYGGSGMPPFRVGRKVTTYGKGTRPFGTTIVPGASSAEGAWTQIVAATSEDHFAFVPSFQAGTDTTLGARGYALDIGLGAATEEEIAQSYGYFQTIAEVISGPFPNFPTFHDAPSGIRLAMRVSGSGVNDSGNYNGVIHAVS